MIVVGGEQGDGRKATAPADGPLAWLHRAPTAIERAWVLELRGVRLGDERPVVEVLARVERMTQQHPPMQQPFAALIDSSVAGAYAELAQSYRASGAGRQARRASDEAVARYRRLLEEDAGLPDDASVRSIRYRLALELERRGNLREAQREYREYLEDAEHDDDRPQASVAVAEALLASGDGTDDDRAWAYDLYRRGTEKAYRDNPVYLLCCCRAGQLALARGQHEAALGAFRKALAHAVEHPEQPYGRELSKVAREGLVAAYAAVGEPSRAYQQFRERNAADDEGTRDTKQMIGLLAWHYHRAKRTDRLVAMLSAALPLAQQAEEPGICALAAKIAAALKGSTSRADAETKGADALGAAHRTHCAPRR